MKKYQASEKTQRTKTDHKKFGIEILFISLEFEKPKRKKNVPSVDEDRYLHTKKNTCKSRSELG
jgi:hypothetical protein